MPNATLVKDIGHIAGLNTISCLSEDAYPNEFDGASTGFGPNSDQIALHYTGDPDLTDANTILSSIEKPTCTTSGLEVTVNVGSYIVDDTTNVLADPVFKKTIKVSVLMDESDSSLHVYLFEKFDTTEYQEIPVLFKMVTDLKEYTLEALGTELVEISNYI